MVTLLWQCVRDRGNVTGALAMLAISKYIGAAGMVAPTTVRLVGCAYRSVGSALCLVEFASCGIK
jgi:hypothetical protein